jgi:hypothetical protein
MDQILVVILHQAVVAEAVVHRVVITVLRAAVAEVILPGTVKV